MGIGFILGSSSPRRAEILRSIGIDFRVVRPNCNEDVKGFYKGVASDIAYRKNMAISDNIKHGNIVLTADTIVVVDGNILGKPRGREDAYRMINMLNNRWHEVYTGICVSNGDRVIKDEGITCVRFRYLTDSEIHAYLKTDEPYDKAGAYGIQGRGRLLVERIEGCFFNVMGLPIGLLFETLKGIGYNLMLGDLNG